MKEDLSSISQMRAITISREYGSGGGEIAARLTKRLGWQLIDHDVVGRVAHELGVSEAEAEAHDERVESLVVRFLTGIQLFEPSALMAVPAPIITDPRDYHEALRRVVKAAASTGHVVIIGRGAQFLLAHEPDVLHVRVVAPLDLRTAYVMRREGLDEVAARARVQLKDRDRIRSLQEKYHQNPQNPLLYDLVVNTAVIDLESAVDLIYLALERKAKRLSTPPTELGPAAGLAHYPGQPHDFRPPESTTETESPG